jgi:Cation transporter/ATPase, N-terminus
VAHGVFATVETTGSPRSLSQEDSNVALRLALVNPFPLAHVVIIITMTSPTDDNEVAGALATEQATGEDSFDAEASLPKRAPRVKTTSDLSGMQNGRIRAARKDRRTVSDMVLFANLPEDVKQKRQRMKSSSDTIKKFSQLAMTIGDDDLRYAEEIAALGTRRQRIASGISDMVVKEKIEEDEEEEFAFNDKGLTTEEAEKLLAIHGKNSLPEKVDPKWLIMVRILTQPMVS